MCSDDILIARPRDEDDLALSRALPYLRDRVTCASRQAAAVYRPDCCPTQKPGQRWRQWCHANRIGNPHASCGLWRPNPRDIASTLPWSSAQPVQPGNLADQRLPNPIRGLVLDWRELPIAVWRPMPAYPLSGVNAGGTTNRGVPACTTRCHPLLSRLVAGDVTTPWPIGHPRAWCSSRLERVG
jgi:hypothetical protein